MLEYPACTRSPASVSFIRLGLVFALFFRCSGLVWRTFRAFFSPGFSSGVYSRRPPVKLVIPTTGSPVFYVTLKIFAVLEFTVTKEIFLFLVRSSLPAVDPLPLGPLFRFVGFLSVPDSTFSIFWTGIYLGLLGSLS